MKLPELSLERWLQSDAGAAARGLWDRLPTAAKAALLRLYPLPRFRVGVLAIVVNRRGEVLLLNHRFRAGGAWGVPGGWLERREAPAAGLCRELREELGLEVSPDALRLVELVPRERRSHLELFYGLRAELSHIPHNVEFTDSGYFSPAELPADMLPLHRALLLRQVPRLSALLDEAGAGEAAPRGDTPQR